MLYLISVWLVLLVVSSVIGLGVLNALQTQALQRPSDRWLVSVWLGMVLLGITLLYVSLGLPLMVMTGLLVAAILVGLALLNPAVRQELNIFRANLTQKLAVYLISALLLTTLATRPVNWTDTGLYHYPVIQWLNHVGSVPGVALLFANFGFTSSWFALAAPLNSQIVGSHAAALTGGLVLLLAVLQLWLSGIAIVTRQARLSDWFLSWFSLLLLLCNLGSKHLLEIAISPSPDIPVAFLTGIIAWMILVITNHANLRSDLDSESPNQTQLNSSRLNAVILPLLLATAACTIKLTALPLLIVSGLFYTFHYRRCLPALLRGWVVALILFAPFLAVQLRTSGCPLFPSSAFCLQTPSSVSTATQQAIPNQTHDWTSWYRAAAPEPVLSVPELLFRWFTDNHGNQIMTLIGVSSLLVMIWLYRTMQRHGLRGAGWLIALQIVGMLFYLKTSPLLRFALPSLLLIPVLCLATFCHLKLRWSPSEPERYFRSKWLLSLAAAIAAAVIITHPGNLLLPPALRSVAVVKKQVNDLTYLSPLNGEVCWSTAIPCAFVVPSDVRLRDPQQGYKAGFVRG
jgi:hypothetical protein